MRPYFNVPGTLNFNNSAKGLLQSYTLHARYSEKYCTGKLFIYSHTVVTFTFLPFYLAAFPFCLSNSIVVLCLPTVGTIGQKKYRVGQ